MHAIYLSIILPGFLAAIWIWPKLRRPWIWIAIGLLTLVGTAVWLGLDYRGDVLAKRPTDRLPRRLIFKVISQDFPVVQLFLAGMITGICARFGSRTSTRRQNEHDDQRKGDDGSTIDSTS